MKIRIQKNSIRFRLKEPEVNDFRDKGRISEVLEFGPDAHDQCSFTLEVSENDELFVRFEAGRTTVYVPALTASEWTTTELVGFEGTADTGAGKTIAVLVEKDFKCIDGRDEENEGSYPNPLEAC